MVKNNNQVSNTNSNTKYVDYLNEDKPIPNQNYVCLSFLSPEKIRNTTLRGLKIRGVFRTREEADEHCKELQADDPDFDVFVGEIGKWLPWDPEPNSAKDQVYQEEELNNLMKGYKDNLEKSKRMQEQRKKDMIRGAAEQEQSRNTNTTNINTNSSANNSNKTRDKLRKKLEAKQKIKAAQTTTVNTPAFVKSAPVTVPVTEELANRDGMLKEQETLLNNERERLNTVQQVINDKEQKVESIDEKLARIQQLYKKLNTQ